MKYVFNNFHKNGIHKGNVGTQMIKIPHNCKTIVETWLKFISNKIQLWHSDLFNEALWIVSVALVLVYDLKYGICKTEVWL